MVEEGEGTRRSNDARRSRRKAASSESVLTRVAGTLVGLVSLLLPWGSIIVRDDVFVTASVTGVGMMELVTSSETIIAIASILFISATVLALIDGRAVIAQIAALIVLWITIPDLLMGMASSLSIPPGWSVSTPIAMGFYLGLLSALIQALTFLPRRRVARRETQSVLTGSERLRPDENPYHAWPGRNGPFHR